MSVTYITALLLFDVYNASHSACSKIFYQLMLDDGRPLADWHRLCNQPLDCCLNHRFWSAYYKLAFHMTCQNGSNLSLPKSCSTHVTRHVELFAKTHVTRHESSSHVRATVKLRQVYSEPIFSSRCQNWVGILGQAAWRPDFFNEYLM